METDETVSVGTKRGPLVMTTVVRAREDVATLMGHSLQFVENDLHPVIMNRNVRVVDYYTEKEYVPKK
jgi:hypothetical protein